MTFSEMLKYWRKRRNLTQIALAEAAGISQRHLSFLEIDRGGPSRSLVLCLSRVLEIPPRHRDQMLIAAGFAPMSVISSPSSRAQVVQRAVRVLVERHGTAPVIVIDRLWNILEANATFRHILKRYAKSSSFWFPPPPGESLNMMKLVLLPGGLRESIANWNEVAAHLVQSMSRDLEFRAVDPEAAKLYDELEPHLATVTELKETESNVEPSPALPFVLDNGMGRVSFFSTITVLGTARDLSLKELRIESFFPTDDETEAEIARWAMEESMAMHTQKEEERHHQGDSTHIVI